MMPFAYPKVEVREVATELHVHPLVLAEYQ